MQILQKVTKLHAHTGSWISLYANLLLLISANINFIRLLLLDVVNPAAAPENQDLCARCCLSTISF